MENEHEEIEICCEGRALELIELAARFMGWDMILSEGPEGELPGLVLGEREFCKDFFSDIIDIPTDMGVKN